jgi:pimeloyl-ACP methyl ester carboxylesterase
MQIGGLEFHVVDEGQGPAVVLLHGFPDSSHLWRHQIPALTEAGYRVVAPDLRGFGNSARPVGVEHYALPTLAFDVVGVLDGLGIERAHVVGHDWGAALAWSLAAMLPERVNTLTALSVGHPSIFATLPMEQRERSWYMLLFQFEGIAETLLSRNDWALMKEWARRYADMDHALAELSRPGALTAALSIYRANVPPAAQLLDRPLLPPVTVPTMGIWSDGDAFLIEEGMTRSASLVKSSFRYEKLHGASHWIPLDAPRELNALLLDFLESAAVTPLK